MYVDWWLLRWSLVWFIAITVCWLLKKYGLIHSYDSLLTVEMMFGLIHSYNSLLMKFGLIHSYNSLFTVDEIRILN
jgi:hypothetical protein